MPATAILLAATFSLCTSAPRTTCVVDGDTIWLNGEKIRIADINTPETHRPGCTFEKTLGNAATLRLVALLNDGPFELKKTGRNRDRYGRLLRTVTRNGASLGDQLVAEGLAERWSGKRSNWCPARNTKNGQG